MQREIVERQNLLDSSGHVMNAGWARDYLWNYNREAIQQPKTELKEWDYYLALSKDFAFAVSMANVGLVSRMSVHFIDFVNGFHVCESDIVLPEQGELKMPLDTLGQIHFKTERSEGTYERVNSIANIAIEFKNFHLGQPIHARMAFKMPVTDKMVIVVPYKDNPELFYYNYKVNNMPVSGVVNIGYQTYSFDHYNAVGTFDWGRGIWEHKNNWYWGSASGTLNGKPFGFNIGHGFGDTSMATESMIFYDGVAHKLDQVTFLIPGDRANDIDHSIPDENYMMDWRFVSNDGRFEMTFKPVYDRQSGLKSGVYVSEQHQVFGLFSGKAILDNGEAIELKDFFGFAEKVRNIW